MKETDGWVKIKKYTEDGKPVCGDCPWQDIQYCPLQDTDKWHNALPGSLCPVWHGESKSDYAYKTVAEYEGIVGYRVNEAFKIGWDMARVTDKMLSDLASNSQEK